MKYYDLLASLSPCNPVHNTNRDASTLQSTATPFKQLPLRVRAKASISVADQRKHEQNIKQTTQLA